MRELQNSVASWPGIWSWAMAHIVKGFMDIDGPQSMNLGEGGKEKGVLEKQKHILSTDAASESNEGMS